MTGSTSPEPRQRLGDFEVIREIGRGGMGIVYEARQLSLNRKVALKVLSGSLGLTATAVARFRREAEAAAKLHHTNIVPIYATGEEEGTHFYAMELIEGPSLNMVIQQMRCGQRQAELRSPASPETHDDITPSVPSWMPETITADGVQPPPGSPEAAVGEGSTTLTAGSGYFDNVSRTIAEVADALDYAHTQGVVHRDIKPSNLLLSPGGRLSINDFGLARMLEQPGMTTTGEFMGSPLYMSPEQIAVGRAPLDHRTDIYSLGATLYELLTLQPPFPGQRRDQVIGQIIGKEPKSPRRVNGKVPLDLETICLKALEKDPDRRYQTAGQMAEDLRRFVNRFAISAKRAGPTARTVKWIRRRPIVAALAALVVVVALAAGLFAHKSRQYRLERIKAEGQHALDQALVEVLSGHYDRVEPWLEQAEVCDIDPGRIRVLRGLAAVEQGDPERAVHELELAVEQLPQSLGAHALLCRAYMEAGLLDKALATDQKLNNLRPLTPEDYLYGAWATSAERPEQAREWLEHLASEHPSPAVHYAFGLYLTFRLLESYDVADIDKTLAHVSAARTGMPGNLRAALFYCLAHLYAAEIHAHEGDAVHSDDCRRKARDTAQQMLAQHPDNGNTRMANASLALAEDRWEDALEHYRKGIGQVGFFPIARFFIPEVLYLRGRYEEALAEIDSMPESMKAASGCVSLRVLLVAELYGPDAAEQAFLQWAAKNQHVPPHRRYFRTFESYCLLGRSEQAFRLCAEHRREYGAPQQFSAFDAAFNRYLAGELSDEALLTAAATRSDLNNTHYIIGLRQLAGGERAGAIEHFSEDTCSRAYRFWFSGSGRALHRLREDPTWPPWIPLKEEPGSQQPAPDSARRLTR
jgi:serine/threonine protein kinase/lipopolysaccharide biosynthesis regulator YciM